MSDLQCACTVVVARHGEAAYEADLWSDAGGSLTTLGREQARRLGQAVGGLHVAHVYTSPLARAVQTAEVAATVLDCGVTVRDGLREFAVGAHAGASRETDPFAQTYARWLEGGLEAPMGGGESGKDVVSRVAGVLEEIADLHRGETVLAVSHGGAMRLALPLIASGRPVAGSLPRLGHTDVVTLRGDADGWVCERWGG